MRLLAYTTTWIEYSGMDEVYGLMVGGSHPVKQTGRGDRSMPRITGVEHMPVVYPNSNLTAYNTFVIEIDFSDGEDRSGVKVRFQILSEDGGSKWFEWPGDAGANVVSGDGVSSGKIRFSIGNSHAKKFGFGKHLINQFRIEDGKHSECTKWNGCVRGFDDGWANRFKVLFGSSTEQPSFIVTKALPPAAAAGKHCCACCRRRGWRRLPPVLRGREVQQNT